MRGRRAALPPPLPSPLPLVLRMLAAPPPPTVVALLLLLLLLLRRDEIASCCEKAYAQLKVADAQKMLMFDSPQAVMAYAREVRWPGGGGWLHLLVVGEGCSCWVWARR